MGYEEIFDAVEVITHFQDGHIRPLRFRWNGRVYPVKRVETQWREPAGSAQILHFSVQSESKDCFELTFDTSNFSWQLARVYLDG